MLQPAHYSAKLHEMYQAFADARKSCPAQVIEGLMVKFNEYMMEQLKIAGRREITECMGDGSAFRKLFENLPYVTFAPAAAAEPSTWVRRDHVLGGIDTLIKLRKDAEG